MLSLICFSPNKSTYSVSYNSFTLATRPNFSNSIMDNSFEEAESMIVKWIPEVSEYALVTSIFQESRIEAKNFVRCISDLHKAMKFLASEEGRMEMLVRAQNLMQMAMNRLQREFYQILSRNRAHLDPESVSARSSLMSMTWSTTSDYEDDEDEISTVGDSIWEVEDASSVAMADLRLIADCMIDAGYTKECVKIYKCIRKSIIDEGIYRLGVEKVSSTQIHKMDWEELDLRIKNWLDALKISMKTLFNGEKILCDHVFTSSYKIRESSFADITKEGASYLFGFPEIVAKSSRKSPRKVCSLLDMYSAILSHWPQIDAIFSFESTAGVQSQAIASLVKIGEATRTALAEFESELQKDKSKSMVSGAGIHPLTIDTMNFLSLLADYSDVLSDILADIPPPATSDSDEYQQSPETLHFRRIILVLLCKLDVKAKQYKDMSFSYLFLANNLQHIVSKVRTSNLQFLLGDDWLPNHEVKINHFAANYERLAWHNVVKSLPAAPDWVTSHEEARDRFWQFNMAFEQAYLKQSSCIIAHRKLRDEIKISIARKLVPPYTEFYNTHRVTMARQRIFNGCVRYAPEDVENCLSDLYFGTLDSSSSSDFSPSRSQGNLHINGVLTCKSL